MITTQNQIISKMIEQAGKYEQPQDFQYNSDDTLSQTNYCLRDAKDLEEVLLRQLKVGEIAYNKVLHLKTITSPSNMG